MAVSETPTTSTINALIGKIVDEATHLTENSKPLQLEKIKNILQTAQTALKTIEPEEKLVENQQSREKYKQEHLTRVHKAFSDENWGSVENSFNSYISLEENGWNNADITDYFKYAYAKLQGSIFGPPSMAFKNIIERVDSNSFEQEQRDMYHAAIYGFIKSYEGHELPKIASDLQKQLPADYSDTEFKQYARDITPTEKKEEYANGYLKSAKRSFLNTNWHEVTNLIDKYLHYHPKDLEGIFMLAYAWLQREEYDYAIKELAKIVVAPMDGEDDPLHKAAMFIHSEIQTEANNDTSFQTPLNYSKENFNQYLEGLKEEFKASLDKN